MKKRLFGSLIITLLSATIMLTAVFAWFSATIPPIESTITAEEEIQTEIASEYQFRQHAFDKYYNSASDVSETAGATNQGQRQSLKLTDNISLSYDLTINRDINLDLNGFTLDLNGFTLSVKHFYHGALVITGGAISEGAVVFDTPNAYIDDSITYVDTTRAVLSQDEAALTTRIFEYVTASLENDYVADIPLIKNYFNSGITFVWASNKPTLVSHNGIFTSFPETEEIVTMTLTLSHSDFAKSYTRDFPLTVISQASDKLDYGEQELNAFFEEHKYGSPSIYIYRNCELPSENKYYGLSYSYATENPDDIINERILNKGSHSRTIVLSVTITDADNQTRLVEYTVNFVLENNLDIVNRIVKDMRFEEKIIINIHSFINLPLLSELTPYGISQAPDYTFINNDGYYRIVHDEETGYDKIVVDSLPSIDEEVFLKMGLSFVANSPSYVEADIRIPYVDASGIGGEQGLDRFSYAYFLADSDLLDATGGTTYKEFVMLRKYAGFGVTYSLSGHPEGSIEIIDDSEDQNNVLFTFHPTYAATVDTLVTVEYFFDGGEGAYHLVSYFTLPGIINNNSEGIPDASFYSAALSFYDADADGVLTINEAAAAKDTFVLLGHTQSRIESYKGIEFFTATYKYNFDNIGFSASDMEYLKQNKKVTHLSMRNCGINYLELDMFAELNRLTTLDIGANNLPLLSALFVANSVVTLIADNNDIETIEGLSTLGMLEYLYIQNNPIKVYNGLEKLSLLKEVFLYNQSSPVIDSYYGAMGRYNSSTYIYMDNKGIKVYNDYNEVKEQPVQFGYLSEQAEVSAKTAAAVLESIFFYGYSKTAFTVPNAIYYSESDFYAVAWDFSSLPAASTATTDDLTKVTHTNIAGIYEIFASVSVGTEQVFRIFYIEVQA